MKSAVFITDVAEVFGFDQKVMYCEGPEWLSLCHCEESEILWYTFRYSRHMRHITRKEPARVREWLEQVKKFISESESWIPIQRKLYIAAKVAHELDTGFKSCVITEEDRKDVQLLATDHDLWGFTNSALNAAREIVKARENRILQ